jgi:4-hydroxyphenylpyruvate dioxygenase-like putative hemolysin
MALFVFSSFFISCAFSNESEKYNRFLHAHDGHLGIGVLGFAVNDVGSILKRYQEKHPKLIDSFQEIAENVKVLEVFAYYRDNNKQQPDEGTVLRFIESSSDDAFYDVSGFEKVEAEFHQQTYPAYFDHWVSNVHSRTDFLDTLYDTLGFTPKVDFNAGVVAAGEAQIESTVTGNNSLFQTTNSAIALRDQSQVYLPINNALSAVGHVHGFLEQLGQGVQHIASRVESLVDFVQQANDHRQILGEGFTFLQIPRSYYGILTSKDLEMEGSIDSAMAKKILDALRTGNILSKDGAVDLKVDRDRMSAVIEPCISGKESTTMSSKKESLLECICLSRYRNLYSLLGSHVSEKTYLAIVRNQILVDIQGEDLLYQIFTSNILQKQPKHEAPFLEFIQRVCSERHDENGCPVAIKPGCGGFGKCRGSCPRMMIRFPLQLFCIAQEFVTF